MIEALVGLTGELGLEGDAARLAGHLTAAAAIVLLAWLADLIVRRLLLRAVHFMISRSAAGWDDALVQHRVLARAAQIAPAVVVYVSANAFGETAEIWIQRLTQLWMVLVAVRTASSLLDAGVDLYDRTALAQEKPILGYAQVATILAWIVAGIFAVSILLQKEPWGLLTGLGAMSAVLLLVFRDSILGFVAGIQIAINDLVRKGDWIEMPSHGADGDVIDISLHTVRVQNWDKTITSIPVQALVSSSFRNWRGMTESGGRRIKRSVLIDVDSVRFCDDEMLERFGRMALLSDYVARRRQEIEQWNREHAVDADEPVNGRRMTNVGTFRAYLRAYLQAHPMIHKEMTFLVRQLAPTREGLPLEIYVFSRDQVWAHYEDIQADIFDHVLAAAPEFGLRVAQDPGGRDVREAGREMGEALGAAMGEASAR